MTTNAVRRAALLLLVVASAGFAACADGPCRLCDAVEARDASAVRTLLEEGEPVTAVVLEVATDPGLVMTRLKGDRPEPRDREIVEMLLDRGDPHARWVVSSYGRRSTSATRVTRFAASSVMELWGDRAMVDLLRRRGLDVNGQAAGEALRHAVANRRHEAVRALIDAGVAVNFVGINVLQRTTPLAEAIQTRDLDVIAMLEAAGAVEWID